jgi:tRNA(adenine34) deaminase
MDCALELAKAAAERGEVPVGAVMVMGDRILSADLNSREEEKNATHHAELLAIEEACRVLGGWRLPECTLYVTMEPCVMCAGAIVNARIPTVVFGARDIRFGAFGSLLDLCEIPLNHRPTVIRDVLGDEARDVLGVYFRRKRAEEKLRKAKTE